VLLQRRHRRPLRHNTNPPRHSVNRASPLPVLQLLRSVNPRCSPTGPLLSARRVSAVRLLLLPSDPRRREGRSRPSHSSPRPLLLFHLTGHSHPRRSGRSRRQVGVSARSRDLARARLGLLLWLRKHLNLPLHNLLRCLGALLPLPRRLLHRSEFLKVRVASLPKTSSEDPVSAPLCQPLNPLRSRNRRPAHNLSPHLVRVVQGVHLEAALQRPQ
jgi:hypothetical protein